MEPISFGGWDYCILLGLLLLARGADFFSTWLATPNLALEANPIAKKLGWKWGTVVNLVLCAAFALWPLPAIVIATTSVLVAARNLQSVWLIRALGQDRYRSWIAEQMGQTSYALYHFCLFTQSLLIASVGGCLMVFSNLQLVPFAVGMGIITYALAVAFYTLLSVCRLRRLGKRT
jgi:hypothetical protein